MNTQLSDDELSRIGFFKNQGRVEFSSRLHAYKRNIILVGSLLLFMLLGDVQLDKFSVGLVSGRISNPYIIKVFIVAFLIYNYVMFKLYVLKEVSGEDARRNVLSDFTDSVGRYIFTKELNRNLKKRGLSFLSVDEKNIRKDNEKGDPKQVEYCFTVTGDKFISEYLSEISTDKDIEVKEAGSYKSVEDGSIGKNFVWRYTLPKELSDYFDKNIAYKKSLHLHEVLELKAPEWYFWIIVTVQIVFFVKGVV